jgi:hypothetical protein
MWPWLTNETDMLRSDFDAFNIGGTIYTKQTNTSVYNEQSKDSLP